MASDAAQSTLLKLWAWGEAHRKQLLWTVIAIVVIGFTVGFFLWHAGETEATASEALSQITGPASAGGPPASPDALLKIVSEYPNTSAAGQALLLAGAQLFVANRPADAQTQFEKYLRDRRDGPFAGQALLGRAACLEAQGKTAEAFAVYKDIVDHRPTESVAPQARFALGRLYEAQGHFDEARDCYEQVARFDVGSLSAQAAERYRALIAAHPPAPTPAPTLMSTPAPAMIRSNPANPTAATNSPALNPQKR